MPGPVRDSYDPEWSTGSNAAKIRDALNEMYDRISGVLGGKAPLFILDLVGKEDVFHQPISATLTEYEWRIIRFALERAEESI